MTTTTAPEAATEPDPGTPPTAAAPAAGGGGGGPVPHTLVRFSKAVDAALDRVAGTPAWSMSAREQRETLLMLDRIESRLAELSLRVLVSADRNQVGGAQGATSTAAWLAHSTRQIRARCGVRTRLAAELDETFAATRAALAAGRVNIAQAEVIVTAVNTLSEEHEDLPDDIVAIAEAHLLDLATTLDATALRACGKRLFEVVCPEAADAAEGAALEKEDDLARRKTLLTLRNTGDGCVEGRFRLPVLHGELLQKALEALTAPRRVGAGRIDPRTGKKIPYPALLGQGFLELLENHLNPATLPSQGGSPFTLVITMGVDALMSGIGVATLESGTRISAGQARRLACRAGIIPAVLGGPSVVLDLGREQRLFSKHQKLALHLRYGGCAAANCDRPPSWTEAHHRQPWRTGGRTDQHNGLPLCPPHHHMADHPQSWNMRTLPSGKVRFSRRQ
jgi:hypothetical protein